MVKHYEHLAPVKDLCRWTLLPRSNYYYLPTMGKGGFKPSRTTLKTDGSQVNNEAVVDEIKSILSGEFVCYGYQKVSAVLKTLDYIINHKKVYRLMDENNLLLGKLIKTSGKRQWVKHRKIQASKPMEYLCLDIKYLWIEGEKRHYYLLTIIDVYSRKIVKWILQKSIRKMDVINLFRAINLEHGIKGVNIRNDNGSQFIANDVRQFLRAAEANQEFTHIATPEENAYIEAYHSIIETEIVQRFDFESYYEAKLTLTAYVDFYNNRRPHGGINYKKPQQVWDEYKTTTFELPGKAEAGNAGEQPVRNIPDNEKVMEGAKPKAPSFLKSFLLPLASENPTQNKLNLLKKSVQTIGG